MANSFLRETANGESHIYIFVSAARKTFTHVPCIPVAHVYSCECVCLCFFRIDVGGAFGGLKTDDMLKKNPNAKIPTCVESNSVWPYDRLFWSSRVSVGCGEGRN